MNPIIRNCMIAVADVGLIGGFIIMNLHGESSVCTDNGYSSYNDADGTCEVTGSYASNIIIVAGNTANSPEPKFENKKTATYDYIKNSVAKYANIKIVSAATGNAVESVEIKPNETNDANGFVESVDNAIATINQKISQTPVANGATYLEAISKAGRDATSIKSSTTQTNSNDDGATVIVIGSGLSDGGILNFADNDLLHKDAADIISAMEHAGELVKDLNDIKVIWSGIGQVVVPQETLSGAEIDNEKEIYRRVLTRRGVNSVIFDDEMRTNRSIDGNKYNVKVTKVINGDIIYDFGDSELSFKADSADLADEQSAKTVLAKVFEDAKNNPSKKITITGYMASGKCDNNVNTDLAGARANTVKSFLTRNGVKNDIETINGGIFEPEKSECDQSGNWQSDLATPKRKVIIRFN